jgi:hypothetical protein
MVKLLYEIARAGALALPTRGFDVDFGGENMASDRTILLKRRDANKSLEAMMVNSEKVAQVAGWVLHLPIAGLMVFAGSAKLFGFAPPEVVSGLVKYGLGDRLKLIGSGEMISAILLLIPLTSSLGIRLTSAFWGGVICMHMAHSESYAFPSVVLLLSWAGDYLRHPWTLRNDRGVSTASPFQGEDHQHGSGHTGVTRPIGSPSV